MDGSSPRAWGTRDDLLERLKHVRFIPTCVGNTVQGLLGRVPLPVHPHVRGEHWPHLHIVLRTPGSSPRAWGTPAVFPPLRRNGRFIPTCVGNTSSRHAAAVFTPVHPHVRGEHIGMKW